MRVIKALKIRGEYFRTLASAKICLKTSDIPAEEIESVMLLEVSYYEEHDWEGRNKRLAYLPMDNAVALYG